MHTLLLLASLLSVGFAATKTLMSSPYDKCSYRHITLDNKLEVLLVQDPTYSVAQACLNVNVGSMHEPDEYNGLAHLLEHMLFLGNSKYPEVGGYKGFIGMHSGTTNATTTADNTYYHFSVGEDYIEEALDRFAQFFISPTFGICAKNDEKENGIMREMKVVDSEYRNGMQNEVFRFKRIVGLLCGEKHPFSRFAAGNLETLKRVGIAEAVIAFFKKYYSANLMKLVVRSGLKLDAVEKMIKERFSAIENLDVPSTVWKLPAITETGKLVKYKLLQEGRKVHYVFPVPGPEPYKTAPFKFLSSLIMSETETGLSYQLKQQSLISTLCSKIYLNCQGFSIFCISFNLTPRGLEQLDTISQSLFAYMQFVKESVYCKEMALLFGEYKQLRNLRELFDVKDQDYATNKASWMHRVDQEKDLLVNPLEFDARQLYKSWSRLTMNNVNVVVSSNQFDNLPLKENFYEIEYSIEKLKFHEGNRKLEFRLPQRNSFTPEDIRFYGSVVPISRRNMRPDLIAEDLWFKMDDSFGQPKSIVFISLQSNTSYNNDNSDNNLMDLHLCASLRLYMRMFCLQMTSLVQDLHMAQLDVSVYSKALGGGLEITISGFSDKLPQAFEAIIDIMTRPLEQKYFDDVKTQWMKHLRNISLEPSFKQAESCIFENCIKGYFSVEELIKATDALEWKDMKLELMTDLKPKMLVLGNTLQEIAIQLFDKLTKAFRGHDMRKMQTFNWSHVGKLIERGPIAHPDNAVSIFYPITTYTNYHVYGAVLMLRSILSDAFYESLRTKEQLGYIVQMTSQTLLDSVGLMFTVQSKVDPCKLHERVHKFITEEAKAIISKLSTKELSVVRDSLFTRSLSGPSRLWTEAQDYWWVITSSSDLFFERNISIQRYLEGTLIESMRTEMINIINMMSSSGKSIAVHVLGGKV